VTNPLRKLHLLIFVLLLAACSSLPQSTPAPTATPERLGDFDRQEVRLVASESQRAALPEMSDADLAELVGGNNAFAFDLYQALREDEGNLFVSPYSISLACAMAYAGARGETEQQMADVLHYTLPPDRLHPAFNALDQELARRGEEVALKPGERYQLEITNAIWAQEGYPILPEYLALLAQNYGAGLRLLDFANAPDACRLTINEWVSDQTRGRIPDLLPPGSIHSLTRLILTNAIYFDASWFFSFDPDNTKKKTFHLLDGGRIRVPMMKGKAVRDYLIGEGYKGVEMRYADWKTSIVIVMPDPGQLESFERSLDAERIEALLGEMQGGEVILTMPTFEFHSHFSLAATLSSMGMPLAFSRDEADFSRILGRQWLYIDGILHKAWVSVDEKGTEAAAATGTLLAAPSLDPPKPPKPVEITIDHPFVFFIRDTETGTILFIGRVVDPSL